MKLRGIHEGEARDERGTETRTVEITVMASRMIGQGEGDALFEGQWQCLLCGGQEDA
jgi:hypothetical protein